MSDCLIESIIYEAMLFREKSGKYPSLMSLSFDTYLILEVMCQDLAHRNAKIAKGTGELVEFFGMRICIAEVKEVKLC